MQLNDLLQESSEYVGQNFNIEALKLDLINSFSLLKRDVLFVTFVHRSFQEYFTSLFLARSEGVELRSIIDELAARGTTEQCTRMLFDIAPEHMVSRWLIPFLQDSTIQCHH